LRLSRLCAVAPGALLTPIAMDLFGILVLDGDDELLQRVEDLRGAFIGEHRQVQGQDDGSAFHRCDRRAKSAGE
jgi:hypothetical protein